MPFLVLAPGQERCGRRLAKERRGKKTNNKAADGGVRGRVWIPTDGCGGSQKTGPFCRAGGQAGGGGLGEKARTGTNWDRLVTCEAGRGEGQTRRGVAVKRAGIPARTSRRPDYLDLLDYQTTSLPSLGLAFLFSLFSLSLFSLSFPSSQAAPRDQALRPALAGAGKHLPRHQRSCERAICGRSLVWLGWGSTDSDI